MITIEIEHESCIKCGKCVRVCPAYILTQDDAKAPIGVVNMEHCIACAHCVDVCPTGSVIHSEFPEEKVHQLDRSLLPLPEQMMELCKARRSNRAFLSKPVPDEFLQQIVEAAHLAPTASNQQQVSFTLVTNPQLLKEIADLTIDSFDSLVKKMSNPIIKPFVNLFMPGATDSIPQLKALIAKHRNGTDTILHDAKALLLIHTPKDSMFGRQDANLAYQNASLMAESLGVSQFYTGFVCIASDLDKKHKLAKRLNIEGTIHAGMALAMPAFKFEKYSDRKELDLKVFE